ncbi:MAG: cytochrome c [Xanthomonadales bacterium]|jgi:mono/diheme cytochrome c family protein|nr:cytochrome c [Xanthomonadales bacterium]
MTRRLLLGIIVILLVPWVLTRPNTIDPGRLPAADPDLANGELLFHAGGCASCHGEDLAGGHEMHTPFGIFRVPNISPDPGAGIGAWSTLDLANAMLRGVSPSGEHYYPAFPYTSYARMEPADVLDLKAWLDTFEPRATVVGDHEVGFPWNIRRGIGLWKKRYLSDEPVIADAGLSDIALRGRYLVEAVGHCGECHTPRDRFGGPDDSEWLAGGPNPDGEGKVPNITPHEDGLAAWSEADIAYYLESGFTPDYDTAGGSMVEVQENFAQLPGSDLAAVAAYLKAVPAKSGSAR